MENYKEELQAFSEMPEEVLTEISTEQLFQEIRNPEDGPTEQPQAEPEPGTTTEPGEIPGLDGGTVNLGSLIEPKDAGELYDGIAVNLLVLGLKMTGQNADKTKLKASSKEKEILGKVLHKCLETINLDFNNPWNALLFCTAMIYGGKVIGELDFSNMGPKSGKLPADYASMTDTPAGEVKRGRGRPRKDGN